MKCELFFSLGMVLSLLSVGLEARRLRKINYRKQRQLPIATKLSSISKPVSIPIIVHYDKVISDVLAKKYGSKPIVEIKALTRKFVKEAEEKFRHPTLNQNIELNLIDVKFLRNFSNILEIDDNSKIYLKNYCEWQALRKKLDGKIYYSVLITGIDLYYLNDDGKKNKKRVGISYNNGVCNFDKSCAVLEWNENIGTFLAHELAHSLGIKHDGPPSNNCVSRGLMMSSVYSTHAHSKAWSSCSQSDLKTFLGSEKASCLK